MKTIHVYKNDFENNDPPKGSVSNPFTYDEFLGLLENSEWLGGYVDGYGYVYDSVITNGNMIISNPGPEMYEDVANSSITLDLNGHKISQFSEDLLSGLSGYSGIIFITSTYRTPKQQATAMYNNIIKYGVEAQRKLYLQPGKDVIDVYKANLTKAENIKNMTKKILEVGPSLVSKHCSTEEEFNKCNIIDVAQSKLSNVEKFKTALQNVSAVRKVLDENGCIHIEINQPL